MLPSLDARGLLLLALDGLLVAALACVLRSRLALAGEGAARAVLSTGTLALGLVTVTGLALGFAGRFSPVRFLAVHALLVAIAPLVLAPRSWATGARRAAGAVVQAARDVRDGAARSLRPPASPAERAAALLVLAVLALAAAPAALTPVVNSDTLAYRLPRIAAWMQEGRVGHFAAFDAYDDRCNYIAFGADLVMAWVAGFFARGFPLVKLVQLGGGVLASAATWALARHAGFTRAASLAAVVVLLGMPNLAAQLTSSQTDLYTTGVAAAALVFLLDGARSGRRSDYLLGGVALGLAVGAKGTLFYWLPGLTVPLAIAHRPRRARPAGWARGAAVAGAAALLAGASPYALNLRSYGSPFSPPAAARLVHVAPSSSRAHFAAFNGAAYLWQLLEPSSNPPLVAALAARAFVPLGDRLAAWAERSPPAPGVLERFVPELTRLPLLPLHEDILSTGLIAAALAALGALRAAAALLRGRAAPKDAFLVALAFAVVAFLVLFCSLQAWSAHKFRYFVLLGPAVAVLALRGLRRPGAVPGRAATVLAGAAVLAQGAMALRVLALSERNGWRALLAPSPAVVRLLGESRVALDFLGREPLRLCLVHEGGHFLRGGVPHRYVFASRGQVEAAGSAEAALATLGCDAMVLAPVGPGSRLGDVRIGPRGPERRVVTVRPLAAGEEPDGLCVETYGLHASGWTERHAWVRLENWRRPTLRLRLENPAPVDRTVALRTSLVRFAVPVAADGQATVDVATAGADRLRLTASPPFPRAEGAPGGLRLTLPPQLDCQGALLP